MMITSTLAAACSLALLASAAQAQALEWRVADGGNGHWYRCVVSLVPMTAFGALDAASSLGAHLVTIASAEENQFALALSAATPGAWPGSAGPWIGAFQTGPGGEPDGGFEWVTGEPWTFSAWTAGNPSNGCAGWTGESAVHFVDPTCTNTPTAEWNDLYPWGVHCVPCGVGIQACIVEWDADCNGDGIVDFGQIQSGALGDWNGNGVPDCCEMPPPPACPGDFNGDGHVSGADLSVLLGFWGQPPTMLPPGMDVDCDGVVTGADLAALLGAWGPCR